jgi:RNA polymerase sigma-70 factor (ECF subfamily)
VLDELPAETPSDGAIDAALAALSPERREVVTLRFVDDLSLAEIAAALDVPLGTVKSRLHLALKELREDSRIKDLFEP